ncbi:MAG: ferredoxin--NADP reductase [Chitinophagaceae bacterium]|nr:ferredoxin--NADP reductase [Chitinophagaceae bacterium]
MLQDLYKYLIIQTIRKETRDVKLFYFGEEARKVITFNAGQYLTFIFKDQGQEVRRSYSIASSPVIHEPLSFGVRRISNGIFSRKLFDQAKVGDTLITLGAGGLFTLPENIHSVKRLIFFAAGTGIIPIYSLIKTALYPFPPIQIQIKLIYSNRSREDTLFYKPLKDLQDAFPDIFRIEFLFSNATDLLTARLHSELISLYLKIYTPEELADSLYYVCGPEAYMRLCTFTLQGLHIPPDNIKREIFHAAKQVHKAAPPDKNDHEVSIIVNEKMHRLRVRYPVSILQSAKNKGLVLPYSCEIGRCGNCMARCVKGKIWMSYNEVLTEKELNRGLILTCTGFPIEGDAIISFDRLNES